MSEIATNNLDSHYSNSARTQRVHKAATAPNSLPKQHSCTDAELTQKINKANTDIYEKTKKNEKKPVKKFVIGFCAAIVSILGIRQIYRFIKK